MNTYQTSRILIYSLLFPAIFQLSLTLRLVVHHESLNPGAALEGALSELLHPDCLGVPLLLFGRLPDAPLLLVDAKDDFGVVVGDGEHFGRLVARHAQILNQQNQLQPVFVRNGLILSLVQRAGIVIVTIILTASIAVK